MESKAQALKDDFSDCERIELNCRWDEAQAVIRPAFRLFSERAELDDKIKKWTSISSSYWYGVIIFAGFVIDMILRKSWSSPLFGADSNYATTIWVSLLGFCLAGWILVAYFQKQHNKVQEKLQYLEMKWVASTGFFGHDFWSLSSYAKDYDNINLDDNANYRSWWKE